MNGFFKDLLKKMELDPMFGGSQNQSLESEFTRTVRKLKEKELKISMGFLLCTQSCDRNFREAQNDIRT